MADLPKYVRTENADALYYVRTVPTRLQSLTPERKIRIPLDCTRSSPTKAILEATGRAAEECEARMKLIESSSPETLSDDVVEANVAALLRKLNAQPGLPNARFVPTDPDDLERFRGATVIDADGVEHVIDPDSTDLMASLQSLTRGVKAGELLADVDANPVIKERARQALIKGSRKKRKRISDFWGEWFADVMDNKSEREKKRYATVGRNLLLATGDCYVDAADAEDRLHAGMDAWVDEQIAERKGKPGIEKALNLWLAAMRRGAKKNRLRWALVPPDLSTIRHRVKQKETLDTEQQALLAESADCLLGALALLQLQTAAMQSEVARLDLKKAMKSLKHSTPYLLFNEDDDGKTANRRRASPVMVRPEVIRKWLPEIHEWLNSVTESNVSRMLGEWLTDLFGSKYTAHGAGRHTFKAQALAVAANPLHVAEIAGWATGGLQIGQHMVSTYGRSAIERSEQLQSLANTSRLMFSHLVEEPPANVVPLKKKKAKAKRKAR